MKTTKIRLEVCHETAFVLENPDCAKVEAENLTDEAKAKVVSELVVLAATIDGILEAFRSVEVEGGEGA